MSMALSLVLLINGVYVPIALAENIVAGHTRSTLQQIAAIRAMHLTGFTHLTLLPPRPLLDGTLFQVPLVILFNGDSLVVHGMI